MYYLYFSAAKESLWASSVSFVSSAYRRVRDCGETMSVEFGSLLTVLESRRSI